MWGFGALCGQSGQPHGYVCFPWRLFTWTGAWEVLPLRRIFFVLIQKMVEEVSVWEQEDQLIAVGIVWKQIIGTASGDAKGRLGLKRFPPHCSSTQMWHRGEFSPDHLMTQRWWLLKKINQFSTKKPVKTNNKSIPPPHFFFFAFGSLSMNIHYN